MKASPAARGGRPKKSVGWFVFVRAICNRLSMRGVSRELYHKFMPIVITIFAEHAWVVDTKPVDVQVGARAGLVRDGSDVHATASPREARDWTGEVVANVRASDAVTAIAARKTTAVGTGRPGRRGGNPNKEG